MRKFLSSWTGFVLLSVIIVILLIVSARGVGDRIRELAVLMPRPVAVAADFVARPIRDFFGQLVTLHSIVSEHGMLKARLIELQNQIVVLEQDRQDKLRLEKELGFIQTTSLTTTACTVISRDPQGLTETIIISCGEQESVKIGQAVVSSGVLVGKIIYVTHGTATVVLLTNPQTAIDASLSRQNISGLLKGSFGSGIILDLLPPDTKITPGELVVTAGINPVIPKNILIGQVGEVISSPNDLFKKLTIQSPVNFHDLRYVFVVR